MEPGSTNLTEAVRSVQHLKIEGYSASTTFSSSDYIKSAWNVSGYDWEVRFYLADRYANRETNTGPKESWVVLKLVFRGVPPARNVRANLGCRLVDPSRNLEPTEMVNMSGIFYRPWSSSLEILLMKSEDVPSSGYLTNDTLTVECTITVLKDLQEITIPAQKDVPVPPSDLHRHLGALLLTHKGGDVTFVLVPSGERFLAHKCILAARSPVFMAEFFGHMNEKRSQCVQIEGVEAAAFEAMLHFIYTDTVPELDDETEKAVTMAQHLLAAADRYGLDRLKLICEGKLSGCIDVDTAATTLVLAEQHNCSLLRAKCVDFITASPEKLDAVLATEGYKHLVASCPFVLTELLKAAHGRRN